MIGRATSLNLMGFLIKDISLINLKKPSLEIIRLYNSLRKLKGKWKVKNNPPASSKRRKIAFLSISRKGYRNKSKKCQIRLRSIRWVFWSRAARLTNTLKRRVTTEVALKDQEQPEKIWISLTGLAQLDLQAPNQALRQRYSSK